jgi:exodeoxyribonuclease VII small subunit
MATRKKTFSFEASLQELEKLVEKMEQSDMGLEESLQAFEKGIALTRKCQQALREAEQKVQVLVEKNSQHELEAFDYADDDTD